MNLGITQIALQRTEQRLVMTPKLQQSLKMLLMSRLELVQHLSEQLEVNPLLEEELIEKELTETEETEEIEVEEAPIETTEEAVDFSWEDFMDDSISLSEQAIYEHPENDDRPQRELANSPKSLYEFLMAQLMMFRLTEFDRKVAEEIVGNIDDDGKLDCSTEELATTLGCETTDVEEVLAFLQRNLEPIGVAYRSIEETLLMQLQTAALERSVAGQIIRKHLEELLNNRIPQIAEELNLSIDEVLEAREVICQLDPYPGRHYGNNRTNENDRPLDRITPDVVLEKVGDEYRVIGNDSGLPKLRLNPFYVDMMVNKSDSLDNETKTWLDERKTLAIELLKNVEQRGETVTKITKAIFEVQAGFLENGVTALKPLIRREIAEKVGVHESTVSRAASSKYVQTPWGMYKLAFFFSAELNTASGTISTTAVRDKIREIIADEDTGNPLSDQAIADLLGQQGIEIARRTIAKYRKQMGILSSGKRRRKWD